VIAIVSGNRVLERFRAHEGYADQGVCARALEPRPDPGLETTNVPAKTLELYVGTESVLKHTEDIDNGNWRGDRQANVTGVHHGGCTVRTLRCCGKAHLRADKPAESIVT
jgi:hypothetical protein